MKFLAVLCLSAVLAGFAAARLPQKLHSNQQTSVESTEEEQFLALQEDGPPPNPHYGDELKNIPKEQTAETEGSAITHGSRIGLQLKYSKRDYLACHPAGNCIRSTCPGLYMEGSDFTICWGEVYTIYKFGSSGNILVGDVVALDYPKESGNWFSLAKCTGHKSPCPGLPTTAFGMSSDDAWFRCWGEVFKIYARGKAIGDPITANDDISLYYIAGDTFLQFVNQNPNCSTCPGKRPPTADKYDVCWGENFEIWAP